MRITVNLPLSNKGNIFVKNKMIRWAPHFNAIIINSITKKESILSEDFLIDTGASVTILRSGLSYLFDNSTPIDKTTLYFGDNKPRIFDVFNVTLRIEGNELEILAAFNKNEFNNRFSLFGYVKGMDNFNHTVINSKKLDFKLIKKY